MKHMTREEIEKALEEKYLGAVISIQLWPHVHTITTKVQGISVETHEGEPMVVFKGTARNVQYKVDVNYFIENAVIHGSTHRTGGTSPGVPEGD